MTEQKQEPVKPTEEEIRKYYKIKPLTWGLISFYLSLVEIFFVIVYVTGLMRLSGNNSVPFSFTLFIFSLYATPIITLGIIFGTLVGTIGIKFKFIKDKNYLLTAICISIINLIIYAIPWIGIFIYDFFGL